MASASPLAAQVSHLAAANYPLICVLPLLLSMSLCVPVYEERELVLLLLLLFWLSWAVAVECGLLLLLLYF